jgi:hypothetical protein
MTSNPFGEVDPMFFGSSVLNSIQQFTKKIFLESSRQLESVTFVAGMPASRHDPERITDGSRGLMKMFGLLIR